MSGCRTVKYDTVSDAKEHILRTDSTDNTHDELRYIFLHDSVFLSQKNDTVTKEVFRTRYIYRQKSDTVFRRVADTVFVDKTVEAVKKHKENGGTPWIIAITLVGAAVVWLVVKKRII